MPSFFVEVGCLTAYDTACRKSLFKPSYTQLKNRFAKLICKTRTKKQTFIAFSLYVSLLYVISHMLWKKANTQFLLISYESKVFDNF
jgi:hypothetical protein